MAITVSLINMKGGVGKSTLATNLAWHCAYNGDKKCLVVDLDPQFNASQYLLGNARYEAHLKAGKSTVREIFERVTLSTLSGAAAPAVKREDVICPVRQWTDGSLIHLVPSRLELAFTLKNPTSKEHLLARFLKGPKADYDLILIDCPPTESILTTAAYMASDFILVPVRPEFLSCIGLPLLVRSLEDFKAQYDDHEIKLAGIVFNSTSTYKKEHLRAKAYVKDVANKHGWYVFQSEVGYSDSYPSGARQGKPIFLTSRARWWKKMELDSVAKEFTTQIGL